MARLIALAVLCPQLFFVSAQSSNTWSLTVEQDRCGQTIDPADLPPLSVVTGTGTEVWTPPGGFKTTTSLPTITPPPFLRPTANDQPDCDIYGPLCQTGSITVGLRGSNGTNATASTTMACSSYLSAQYSSIPDWPWFDDEEWMFKFGRSEQCKAMGRGTDDYLYERCGNASFAMKEKEKYWPRGVESPTQLCGNGTMRNCCGSCQMVIREIKVFYFPSSNPWTNCTTGNSTNSTSPSESGSWNSTASSVRGTAPAPVVSLAPGITARAEGLEAASTVVLDGYTYTSPSFYLHVSGNLYPSDNCGAVDPVLTDPIIPVNPTDMFTISAELEPGATWVEHEQNFPVHTKPFNVDEAACPTWGLSDRTSYPVFNPVNGLTDNIFYYTVGAPYHPVIVPPEAIRTAASGWAKTCMSFPTNTLYPYIFDPPSALVKQTGLAPNPGQAPTTTSPSPSHPTTPLPAEGPTDFRPTTATQIPSKPSDPPPNDPQTSQHTGEHRQPNDPVPSPVPSPPETADPPTPSQEPQIPSVDPPTTTSTPDVGGIISSGFASQNSPRPTPSPNDPDPSPSAPGTVPAPNTDTNSPSPAPVPVPNPSPSPNDGSPVSTPSQNPNSPAVDSPPANQPQANPPPASDIPSPTPSPSTPNLGSIIMSGFGFTPPVSSAASPNSPQGPSPSPSNAPVPGQPSVQPPQGQAQPQTPQNPSNSAPQAPDQPDTPPPASDPQNQSNGQQAPSPGTQIQPPSNNPALPPNQSPGAPESMPPIPGIADSTASPANGNAPVGTTMAIAGEAPLDTADPIVVTFSQGSQVMTLDIPQSLSNDITRITAGAPLPTEGGVVQSIAADGSLVVTPGPASQGPDQSASSDDVRVTITNGNEAVTLDIPKSLSNDISRITSGAPAPTAGGRVVSIATDGSLVISSVSGLTGAVPSDSSQGSNVLVVGSSSITLDPTKPTTQTVGDQTITAQSGSLVVGSSTLTPGGDGITIGGQVVSLISENCTSSATKNTLSGKTTSRSRDSSSATSLPTESDEGSDSASPTSSLDSTESSDLASSAATRATLGCSWIGLIFTIGMLLW